KPMKMRTRPSSVKPQARGPAPCPVAGAAVVVGVVAVMGRGPSGGRPVESIRVRLTRPESRAPTSGSGDESHQEIAMTCRDVGPGAGGTGWERRAQEPGPRGRSGPPAPGRVLRERPLPPGARQGSDVLISAGHFGEG